MNKEKKFEIYLTVLRFIVYKVTENLKQIYLDIDLGNKEVNITAYYKKNPSMLELELLDDICTNSKAHIPDFIVNYEYKLAVKHNIFDKHDFIVFSVYEEV